MKKSKLPNLVAILILTLITAVIWVSFNIYRAVTSEPPTVVDSEILEPLNPTLDIETINLIESGIYLDDSQIPENVLQTPPVSTDSTTATVQDEVPAETPTPEESPEEVTSGTDDTTEPTEATESTE